jgi:hypothetical protein
MTLYRSTGLRIIDRAHSAIADAEMLLAHSFTAEDKATALDKLANAQRFLCRACDTWKAWQSIEHDDYEQYPDVPEVVQGELLPTVPAREG